MSFTRELRISPQVERPPTDEGQDSGLGGRVLRISFGFTVPVFVSGQ